MARAPVVGSTQARLVREYLLEPVHLMRHLYKSYVGEFLYQIYTAQKSHYPIDNHHARWRSGNNQCQVISTSG